MSTIQQLESIIVEANEALTHATSGGRNEHAFNLVVDSIKLADTYNILLTLNTAIYDELFSADPHHDVEVEADCNSLAGS